MEIGRKGMVGNGHTSRVWKGDGQWILNGQYLNHTGIGHFISDFGMRLPAEPASAEATTRRQASSLAGGDFGFNSAICNPQSKIGRYATRPF